MFICPEGKYHLHTVPRSDGQFKIYIIHDVTKCQYVDEYETDLQCLGADGKKVARNAAKHHITSLHCTSGRIIEFCERCCRR